MNKVILFTLREKKREASKKKTVYSYNLSDGRKLFVLWTFHNVKINNAIFKIYVVPFFK